MTLESSGVARGQVARVPPLGILRSLKVAPGPIRVFFLDCQEKVVTFVNDYFLNGQPKNNFFSQRRHFVLHALGATNASYTTARKCHRHRTSKCIVPTSKLRLASCWFFDMGGYSNNFWQSGMRCLFKNSYPYLRFFLPFKKKQKQKQKQNKNTNKKPYFIILFLHDLCKLGLTLLSHK